MAFVLRNASDFALDIKELEDWPGFDPLAAPEVSASLDCSPVGGAGDLLIRNI